MSVFIPFLLMLAFVVCPLAALLFVVRLVVAQFSTKVSEQMRKHPVIHIVWGCLGFVGVLVFLGGLNPTWWPPPSVERRAQRQAVLQRVQKAGGWEAVRLGCEALVSNHPDGLYWFPPSSNVWVYPNPQTEPNRYYVTNLDYGPLPPSVAALRPFQVQYAPRSSCVSMQIFGMHRTGGHDTPYFGLEVDTSTNRVGYEHGTGYDNGGVIGNYHSVAKQVAEGIYEIY
jgi:hypothetical protein